MTVDVGASCESALSPGDVWQLLIDPSRIPEWNSMHAGFVGDVPTRLTDGGHYTQRVKLLGMAILLEWTVVGVSDPASIELLAAGPAGMTVRTRYEIGGHDHGTKITMTSSFAGGPADTAFAPAMKKVGQKAAEQTAARLSELLA